MFLALDGFLLVFLSIIALIFIIGLIVCIHEFGHFLVARKAGIKCHEFSIGMGPALYKHQFKETLFCIRAIPLGGYVSMASEEMSCNLIKEGDRVGLILEDGQIKRINADSSLYADVRGVVSEVDLYDKDGNGMYVTLLTDENETISYSVLDKATYFISQNQSMTISPYKDTFDSKSLLRRFLTLFAGPFMNFVLAIVLYFIYFCFVGVPNLDSNEIGSLTSGYKASYVLEEGDKIVAVGDTRVNSWNEFEIALDEYNQEYNAYLPITVLRDGEEKNFNIEYSVIINSIGLSNLQNEEFKYPEGLTSGAIVGNLSLRYLDDKEEKYMLKPGDVITKMRVDNYTDKNNVVEGEVIIIEDWQDIINGLKDVDVANVYFEYYSFEKAKENSDAYVHLEESKVVQTWGNETLNNQRIEKISLKIGVSPVYHFSLGGVISTTFKQFWSDFTLIFRTLKLLIAPSGIRQVGLSDMSSVVGIFGIVEQIIVGGVLPLIAFTAMLSINIAIMNLLPIPALDGGRIVFLGYELVTRRKPNKKFETILNNVFFILLMLLFIYVTFNDIGRLMTILI